jgi:two-component system response regulator RegX3
VGQGLQNRAVSRPKVEVIETDPQTAELLNFSLTREGFGVTVATTGAEGWNLFESIDPDLVILELNLPEISGLELCRRIRAESRVPILVLSVRDSVSDKVAAFELGADDYVTKPFSTRELVSRVRAWLRRAAIAANESRPDGVFKGGPVELDVDSHEARVNGSVVELTPKEFALMELLLRRKGRLISREHLIEEIWGLDRMGYTKTLDAYVKRLRSKIEEKPKTPRHIVTVRGLGYKFVD